MTVLLASGEVVRPAATENADLFWATFGGMGLLGVVLTATLRLRRIETTYFTQKAIRAVSLEAMLAALDENDHDVPLLRGDARRLRHGRAARARRPLVGDHARSPRSSDRGSRADPLARLGPTQARRAVRAARADAQPADDPRRSTPSSCGIQSAAPPVGHYERFFYPLDKIAHWNRGYGRRGFTQYQFVIPFEDGLAPHARDPGAILSSGELPFLNVLKRFGKESGGVLSFPREGYTFAIDFPMRAGTVALLQRLDAMVLDAGGRVYLGKDSFVDAATFRAMYPALDSLAGRQGQVRPRRRLHVRPRAPRRADPRRLRPCALSAGTSRRWRR